MEENIIKKENIVNKKKKKDYRIVPSLWVYNHEDKTTWRYIETKMPYKKSLSQEECMGLWIENPDFAYSHLFSSENISHTNRRINMIHNYIPGNNLNATN